MCKLTSVAAIHPVDVLAALLEHSQLLPALLLLITVCALLMLYALMSKKEEKEEKSHTAEPVLAHEAVFATPTTAAIVSA